MKAGHSRAEASRPRRRVFWSTLSALSFLLPLTAASEAGAQGLDGPYLPPKQLTVSPAGVDLQSGKFSYSVTDLSIGPLTLNRSFLGGHEVYGNAFFGPNWSHNHSIYAYEKDLPPKLGGLKVIIAGKTLTFTRAATYFYWDGPEAEGTFLEGQDGAFVYTDQQGNVYTFNKLVIAVPSDKITSGAPNQRIARIDYANGHRVSYTYSGMQLTEIASNFGYAITFQYGSNGYISKACGHNRATAQAICNTYRYDSPNSANVSEMVDGLDQKWGYDYASGMQLTCVRQVNSSSCRIANSHEGTRPRQVTRQTTPDGVWTYGYDEPDREYDPNAHNGYRETTGGGFTDPEGNGAWAEFYSGQLKRYHDKGRVTDPDWNPSRTRITELDWNGLELVGLTHHEGNKISYARRGELILSEAWTPKPGSDLAPIFTSSKYPDRGTDGNANGCDPSVGRKRCNKPEWKADWNGNKTHYTYWPEHGGVKTETGPAVGGISPQKRYTYVARTASAAPAGPPIWLVSTVSFCRTSNSPPAGGCETVGDEVVTSFDYEPNNLNLRSETVTADGVSRRTCHTYDWQGNKVSTTGPMGTCS